MNQTDKAKAFANLHRKGDPVVLYNIWDAGTAKAVTASGAKALATGSWSVADANGYGDGQQIPMQQLVDIARSIVAATELPVSIDFEGGYAEDADATAQNVGHVIDTGAVGINFEDQVVGGSGLHTLEAQAARVKAIRAKADEKGIPFFINARTDLFLKLSDPVRHAPLVDEAIERAAAYAEAGASRLLRAGIVEPGPDRTGLRGGGAAGQHHDAAGHGCEGIGRAWRGADQLWAGAASGDDRVAEG